MKRRIQALKEEEQRVGGWLGWFGRQGGLGVRMDRVA